MNWKEWTVLILVGIVLVASWQIHGAWQTQNARITALESQAAATERWRVLHCENDEITVRILKEQTEMIGELWDGR
jgi:hypothetical protein